jgi:FixJ family two-component response regulator
MLQYKIYVIDDEKFIGEGLKHAFHDFETSFDVTIFTDPAEGLHAAITSPPDLIFLDLLMPYINGEEILKQLKKKNVPTRVVVLTAVTDIAKVVEVIRNGACHYVTKPFSPKEIIKIAKRVVVLEDTLDKAEPTDKKTLGRDLRQELLYSLYLNILEHFSLSELGSLCFRVGIDFDSLSGSSKEEKTRELVQFCNRHNKIPELAKICSELRPHVEEFLRIAKSFF